MIKTRYNGVAYKGTLAEFTASTHKWALGSILMPSDSNEVRIGTGTAVFTALISLPASATPKADKIASIGTPTPLTVIGATFADLAAARGAVNTLRTDAEARLHTLETKYDALLAGLIAGNLMKSS